MFRCPYCHSNKSIRFGIVSGYIVNKCKKCTLLITQVGDSQRKRNIKEQYGMGYINSYKKSLSKFYKRYEMYKSLIEDYCSSGLLLDVGCGTGYFLQFLKKRNAKYTIYGVEPDNLLREIASRNTGEIIKKGSLGALPFANNYFDVITCLDVLEHDVQLKTNIEELKRVLKPGGCLLIQAPNYKSAMAYITGVKWDWWSPPDHVLHFSPETLLMLIKGANFKPLYIKTYDDAKDYFSNIKGAIFSKKMMKPLYYLLLPLFALIKYIAGPLGRGGLQLIIAQKR